MTQDWVVIKQMLSEKYLAWNTSGNLNFWEFISIFIKKKRILWKILVNNKKGKEYLKRMGIEGFNLYWPNNGYKNISPPDFGADSHITTKPSCSRY